MTLLGLPLCRAEAELRTQNQAYTVLRTQPPKRKGPETSGVERVVRVRRMGEAVELTVSRFRQACVWRTDGNADQPAEKEG